jgi:hypothetical protein
MKMDATQVAQRAADSTDLGNAQFTTSRRASNSVGHNPASGIQRIVAKAMVQDPLESLPKVSITVRSRKINASVPNYREVAENPPCISQVPFVPSTTGKKHGLSKLFVCAWLAHGSKPRVAKTLSVAPFFFFFPFKPPSRSADMRGRVGLGPPLFANPAIPPVSHCRPAFLTSSREKRALCELFTVSSLATSKFKFLFFFFGFFVNIIPNMGARPGIDLRILRNLGRPALACMWCTRVMVTSWPSSPNARSLAGWCWCQRCVEKPLATECFLFFFLLRFRGPKGI